MIVSRLEQAASELFAQVKSAANTQLRQVAFAACQMALQKSGLSDVILDRALTMLQSGNAVDSESASQIAALVDSLDEQCFVLLNADDLPHSEITEIAFAKARAANAILFACAEDEVAGTYEAIYEAMMIVDSDLLLRLMQLTGPGAIHRGSEF